MRTAHEQGESSKILTTSFAGGTVDSQKDFLEALAQDSSQRRRPLDRSKSNKPPVANKFALGYTYQDVLDADQDGMYGKKSVEIRVYVHSQTSWPVCRFTYSQTQIPSLDVSSLLSSRLSLYPT